jgi:hypothetical protein
MRKKKLFSVLDDLGMRHKLSEDGTMYLLTYRRKLKIPQGSIRGYLKRHIHSMVLDAVVRDICTWADLDMLLRIVKVEVALKREEEKHARTRV